MLKKWVILGVTATLLGSFHSAHATYETDWNSVDEELSFLPPEEGEVEAPAEAEVESSTPVPPRKWVAADFSTEACFRMHVHIFLRPRNLSVPHEFGILEVDGKVKNVFAISSGRRGHRTLTGDYVLSAAKIRGIPYPWLRSQSYENSPMFWGLKIDGSFWIHSTTHYRHLGVPASMGCVRLNFPTAMEIWDQSVNYSQDPTKISLYPSGSARASAEYQRLKEASGLTDEDIRNLIQEDLDDAHAVSWNEYNGTGHGRRTPGRVFERFKKGYFPSCYHKNCLRSL